MTCAKEFLLWPFWHLRLYVLQFAECINPIQPKIFTKHSAVGKTKISLADRKAIRWAFSPVIWWQWVRSLTYEKGFLLWPFWRFRLHVSQFAKFINPIQPKILTKNSAMIKRKILCTNRKAVKWEFLIPTGLPDDNELGHLTCKKEFLPWPLWRFRLYASQFLKFIKPIQPTTLTKHSVMRKRKILRTNRKVVRIEICYSTPKTKRHEFFFVSWRPFKRFNSRLRFI